MLEYREIKPIAGRQKEYGVFWYGENIGRVYRRRRPSHRKRGRIIVETRWATKWFYDVAGVSIGYRGEFDTRRAATSALIANSPIVTPA